MRVSAKEELHQLVDQLGNEQAREALALLRALLDQDNGSLRETQNRPLAGRTSSMMAGPEFYSEDTIDLRALAAHHGVKPVTNFDALLGGFWPGDDDLEDFAETVRQWRREGGYV